MKVHSHALDAYTRTALTPINPARATTPSESVGGDAAAHVTVSAEARALAARSQGDGYDAHKVAALKAKVDEGSYAVNAQQLAVRLLDHFE